MPNGFKVYCITLRSEILKQITGIENADGTNFSWDTTTPNSVTSRNLHGILNNFSITAERFGVHKFDCHGDCGSRKHRKLASEHDYLYVDRHSNILQNGDLRIISNFVLFPNERNTPCPCDKDKGPVRHFTSQVLFFDPGADINHCRKIARVLEDLSLAIENAGDKRPRSAIREHLLQAVLRLNDMIMPQPIDEYISHEMDKL